MASTAGFRHNRLKRRHLEPDGDLMPDNKRYFSEKIAHEMGVLKLDDHATVPQSIGSPQSPYSSSPPQTFTPPPSPFHIPSYQQHTGPFAPPSSPNSPSPFSYLSSQQQQQQQQQPSSSSLFSQRFTAQNFQQQLNQLHQLHHPVNQYQLQQQLQNHQLFQMRHPSSPPTTPIPSPPTIAIDKNNKAEPKALTLYQPFQFTVTKTPELDVADEEIETEEEKKDDDLPTFTVSIPEIQKLPELLIPLPHEDKSKALILYSSPSDVIQSSIAENAKKERRAAKELREQLLARFPQAEAMEEVEPTPTILEDPTAPFSSFPNTFIPSYQPPSYPSGYPPANYASPYSPVTSTPPLSPSIVPPFPSFTPFNATPQPPSEDSMME